MEEQQPMIASKSLRHYAYRENIYPRSRDLHVDRGKVVYHRDQMDMKVDLHSRMIKQAFELAKQSFDRAHGARNQWFPRIREYLNSMLDRVYGKTTPVDFIRTFELFKDWYPKLVDEVRHNSETYDICVASILLSLENLNVWTTDDSPEHKLFKAWRDKEWNKIDVSVKQHVKAHNALLAQKQTDLPILRKLWAEDKDIDIVQQNLQAMHALTSTTEASAESKGVILEFFSPFLRIVWAVMTIDSLFIYEAVAIGLLTQIMMELNIGFVQTSDYWFFRSLRNLFLPVFVFFYAVVGAELADLVHASFQSPPFTEARAGFIIALMSNRGVLAGKIDKIRLRVIDSFFTWVLLMFIVVGFIISDRVIFKYQTYESWFDIMLNGMTGSALLWIAVFLILHATARLYNNIILERQVDRRVETDLVADRPSTPSGDDAEVCCLCCVGTIKVAFRPARLQKVLASALGTYAVNPGDMWKYFLTLQNILDMHKADDYAWTYDYIPKWQNKTTEGLEDELKEVTDDAKLEPWTDFANKLTFTDRTLRKDSVNKWVWWFAGSTASWLCTLVILWLFDAKTQSDRTPVLLVVGNLGFALAIALMSQGVRNLFPVFADSRLFRAHLWLFVIFMAIFSCASIELFEQRPTGAEPIMTLEPPGDWYNDGNISKNQVFPYPACNMWWGSAQAKVNLMDLAAMASYAYIDNESSYLSVLNTSFGEENVSSVYWNDYTIFPHIEGVRLCRSEGGPCSIIVAVRGTSNKVEVLTDLGLFSTVVVIQMLDKLGPVLGTVPVSIISNIMSFFRTPYMKNKTGLILQEVEEVLQHLKEKYPNDGFVLTGHSLGGALAELVGARKRTPAVGFSAPGQFYMLNLFNLHRESISQNIVTIMPSLDPVPRVATHVDMVQRIECRGNTGSHRYLWDCHSLDYTICELWRVCGDPLKRDFTKMCLNKTHPESALVNENCIGKKTGKREAECYAKT